MTTEQALSVLGLKANEAVLEDVKPAYRRLVKLLHPDKGGDESKFKELVAAYELLTGRGRGQRTARRQSVQYEYVWMRVVCNNILRVWSLVNGSAKEKKNSEPYRTGQENDG